MTELRLSPALIVEPATILGANKRPYATRSIPVPQAEPEEEDVVMSEIQKWQWIIDKAGPEESGLARKLQHLSAEERVEELCCTFRSAPGTLAKHSGAMFLFVRYCADLHIHPCPLQESKVYEYAKHLNRIKAPANRVETFVSACKYATSHLRLSIVQRLWDRDPHTPRLCPQE